MEATIRLFRDTLFSAFYEWLEKNKAAIGEKWYSQLFNEAKEAENDGDNAVNIMGVSLWMFNTIANMGVLAGIGPDKVSIHEIDPRLDENSTKRLLRLISATMNLQYLSREIATMKIPVISSRKFSLKLWINHKS